MFPDLENVPELEKIDGPALRGDGDPHADDAMERILPKYAHMCVARGADNDAHPHEV